MNLNAVVQLHMAGNISAAEDGYRSLIAEDPGIALAYRNLAFICLNTGRIHEGINLLETAIELNPNDPELHFNLGVGHMQMGAVEPAIACYQKAISIKPDYPEALINLGVLLSGQGRLDDSISAYKAAIEARTDYVDAHYNLGNAYLTQGKRQEAISCYQKVIEFKPDHVSAYLMAGNASAENLDEAASYYRKAIDIKPDYKEAHNNLGNVYIARGDMPAAAASFRKSLDCDPNYPAAHNNLGLVLRQQGKLDEAVSAFRKALELSPDYPEALTNLGLALKDLGRAGEAIVSYQKALEILPDYADAHSHLGAALAAVGKTGDAISSYQKALELSTTTIPGSSPVRKLGALLNELERIPVIYKNESEIEATRENFTTCLNEAYSLAGDFKSSLNRAELAILRPILFRLTNFYLGYQQQNDRDLQIKYADLATRLLGDEIRPYLEAGEAPEPNARIRIGLASEMLKQHNGSLWAYGWLANLPPDDYEIFLYSINGHTDEMTERFAALGTYRWLPFRETNYLDSLAVIKQDNLDVLIFPDVGMTAHSKIISLARLAPVQCVGWGHPITTGSRNIDFYLSGEYMETEESDNYYSEKLVRLANTGLYLERPEIPEEILPRVEFGIPEGCIAYGTVQSLFKYLPRFDFVYPSIAKQVPNALFVFVEHPSDHVTSVLVERLKAVFAEQDLDFDKHVKFLPQMPFSKFMQLLKVLDVNLDSIGFNGGTTAMRCLESNCPVVALAGRTMIGRAGSAMLKMAGLEELIADSLDDYVAISSRLGQDKAWRFAIVEKIKAQKHRLFEDMECVNHLDRFLKAEVNRVRTGAHL